MKNLFLVVAGFLGLLLVTNGAFAQTYTPVFSDDFNRPDSTDMGGGWTESFNGGTLPAQSSRSLNENKAQRTAVGWETFSVLLSPITEKVSNGKAEMTFIKDENFTTAPAIFARYTSGANAPFYLVWLLYGNTGPENVSLQMRRYTLGDSLSAGGRAIGGYTLPNISDGTPLKVEFEVQDIGIDQTRLVATVYSGISPTPLIQVVATDTSSTIPAGQWGISSYGSVAFDDFSLYKIITPELSLSSNVKNIEFGNSITYIVSDDENQTVIFSDGNAGGTFSPSNEATLTAGNTFSQMITYIPAHLGNITITATSDGLNTPFESNIFVSPYATSVGFIGDSITSRVANNGTGSFSTNKDAVTTAISKLGSGFAGINRGVSGSTTRSRISDGYVAPAITAFQNANVDVVSIMLGSNDANGNFQISSGEYKANLQIIIDALKAGGIRQVVLQNPIYRDTADAPYKQRLLDYQVSIAELVAENAGYVLQGGVDAYNYFEANTSALGDGLHPTESGHIQLGTFRAEAIKSLLEYQISPNASFLSGNTRTLGTTGSLTLRVDKYFGEFSDVVKVDGGVAPTTGYEATSGSTTIELNVDYLNTLSAGDHTLTIGFKGGVWVAEDFTILPEPTVPPVTPPTVPSSPSVSYAGGGGGGGSVSKDSCPNGDFSQSYYDGICGTTADLTEEVAKKVNLLRPLIRLIYLTATEEQKTFVYKIITSCSETNKNEIIKLACQELVENWDF